MERAKSADEITRHPEQQAQFLEAGMRPFEEVAIGFGHRELL
jgi:hypothetical protein